MNYTDRQRQIIKLLSNRSMSISDIAENLYVSQMTIRRDVSALKKLGCITQFRGGIALNNQTDTSPIDIRENTDKNAKLSIAKKAVQFVRDGMLLYIDNSSTCYNLVPLLGKFRNLQVITNSTKVLQELGEMNIRSKMVCGNHYFDDKCVCGSDAEEYIRRFRYDIAFISAGGYNDNELTDWNEGLANVRRSAIESAIKTVALMIPSKYDKNYPYFVCNSRNVDIITLA